MDKSLFYHLQDAEVYFKPLNMEDAEAIHSYTSNENVSRFIGWKLMKTLEDTRSHIENMIKRDTEGTHLHASIVLKSTDAIIGTAMIFSFDEKANHAEIGYVLHQDYWGKGYGTRTIALMNDFAFKALNLHKLHARVISANIASAHILEKNGFELEGRLKDYYVIDNTYCDSLLFAKMNSR